MAREWNHEIRYLSSVSFARESALSGSFGYGRSKRSFEIR